MSNTSKTIYPVLYFVAVAAATSSVAVHADGAGAFVGGVMAAKVMNNMQRRTEAEERQAYYASRPQSVPQQSSAPAPRAQGPEEKLQQLDRLAAGGYITPEEYKAKRKAILEGM